MASAEHRARYGLLRLAAAEVDSSRTRELKTRLGILDKFLVLGPFHARRQTMWVVIPPETHVDLSKKDVQFRYGVAKWKSAKVTDTGYVNLRDQGYGYPDNACAIALAYIRVDAATPARFWLGSDDGHALYVNGELLQKEPRSHRFRFDDQFADTHLAIDLTAKPTDIDKQLGSAIDHAIAEHPEPHIRAQLSRLAGASRDTLDALRRSNWPKAKTEHLVYLEHRDAWLAHLQPGREAENSANSQGRPGDDR